MYAKNYEIGQRFQHTEGFVITVIQEDGEKIFDIENVGFSSFIEDE